jgi:hypothetical protein
MDCSNALFVGLNSLEELDEANLELNEVLEREADIKKFIPLSKD